MHLMSANFLARNIVVCASGARKAEAISPKILAKPKGLVVTVQRLVHSEISEKAWYRYTY
jgi:hypothetical protein